MKEDGRKLCILFQLSGKRNEKSVMKKIPCFP